MKTIYHYVLQGMAEWETGYLLQILNKNVRFVGLTKEPVKTLSGLTVVPDATIDEISSENTAALILPGSDSWSSPDNELILQKALTLLEKGVVVGALCGATLALADLGVFNNRNHTSNALEFLKYCSKNYSGENYYQYVKSCRDKNLITASVAGGIEFARDVASALELHSAEYLDAWYKFYTTGEPKYFTEMMAVKE